MTNHRNRRKKQPIVPKLIALAVLGFALGFYMLNYLSRQENILFGPTFHIVIGCALMAATTLYVVRAFYKRYFERKSHRRSRPVFLNNEKKTE